MKQQFAELLFAAGFVMSPSSVGVLVHFLFEPKLTRPAQLDAEANVHAGNLNMVKAVLCAALYPSVVKCVLS